MTIILKYCRRTTKKELEAFLARCPLKKRFYSQRTSWLNKRMKMQYCTGSRELYGRTLLQLSALFHFTTRPSEHHHFTSNVSHCLTTGELLHAVTVRHHFDPDIGSVLFDLQHDTRATTAVLLCSIFAITGSYQRHFHSVRLHPLLALCSLRSLSLGLVKILLHQRRVLTHS